MSDFLFTSKQQPKGILTNYLKSIHLQDPPDCFEYHGSWGSLGVLYSHYHGFNPYEDERHLLAVIGGPILKFSGAPSFSKTMLQNARTMAILKKWKKSGRIQWDKDLSGPFAIICIDKKSNIAEIVTDMMSFIPVFQATVGNGSESVVMGTHVDTVAEIQGHNEQFDETSLVDFFINKAVTFPYTLYKNVIQISPATTTLIENGILARSIEDRYWLPIDNNQFDSCRDAAHALHCAMNASIQGICRNQEDVAVLLSGGEDSRAVLAAIPNGIKKTGYIFVDSFNREARTAKRIAGIYGAEFVVGYRSITHYLDQIVECSRLVGSQNEFIHVHAYGFHSKFRFKKHGAILGGLKSDTFLKGYYIPHWQIKIRGSDTLQFKHYLLENEGNIRFYIKNEILSRKNREVFNINILENIVERQLRHLNRVLKFRKTAVAEWFKIWPISQDQDITNFGGHRRLFRNFEPFLDSDVVKLAASIPQEWKTGRNLFQRATKPFFRPSWFVPHAGEGHFPYFSMIPNVPLRLFCIIWREIYGRLKNPSMRYYQGPWPELEDVVKTKRMHELIEENRPYYRKFSPIFNNLPYSYLFAENLFFPSGKLRFLQALNSIDPHKINKCS
jgi:asparagine synthetase B (glutamine-hydrolysing)